MRRVDQESYHGAMEKANFEFNVQSRAYEDKLRQTGQWEKFNLMRETAKNDLRTHEADYKAHRDQRIAEKAKEIADGQKPGARLERGPARRPLTAQEIQARATWTVDDGHKRSYGALYKERHTSINQFVQQVLNLRPKGFDQSRSGWLRDFDRTGGPKR